MASNAVYSLDDFAEVLKKNGVDVDSVSYVDPSLIFECVASELKIKNDLSEYKKMIKSKKVTINEEMVKDFLDKRFSEKEPEIKRYIESLGKVFKPIEKWSTEELAEDMMLSEKVSIASEYMFRQDYYDLFINRVEILKKRINYTVYFIELLSGNKKSNLEDNAKFDYLKGVYCIDMDASGDISRNNFTSLCSLLINATYNLEYATFEANNLESYLYKPGKFSSLKSENDLIIKKISERKR